MRKSIHRSEYQALCQLLRRLRLERHLKQSDVASALGKPQPFISAVETGERRIDIVELRDLCNAIGLSLVEFCELLEEEIRSEKATRKPGKKRAQKA